MTIQPTLKSLLLCAAGSATILTMSACSSQVKVQKVVYDAPHSAQTSTPSSSLNSSSSTSTTTPASFTDSSSSWEQASKQHSPTFLTEEVGLFTLDDARTALETIYDLDARIVSTTQSQDPNQVHSIESIAQMDRHNTEILMHIIQEFGWPTREMVGIKGVQGAYITVQHAGHDPEFQSNCLALIQQQVDQGELPGAFLALMTDRVSLSRGEPQIYGTQMTMAPDSAGVMKAVPAAKIRDLELLDQRRAALGMPSHDRFIQAIEIAYFDSIKNSQTQLSSAPTD